MEAYENHIAKCSRPRVRTGIRARFLLWRRRPAPSKQHRPIATHGRDGSGCNPTGYTDCDPSGRNATGCNGCNPTGHNGCNPSGPA
jgi:hypothetical protein